jgi:hypothetical protein
MIRVLNPTAWAIPGWLPAIALAHAMLQPGLPLAQQATPPAPPPAEASAPAEAPRPAADELEAISAILDEVDSLVLQDENEAARARLEEAATRLEALAEREADRLPAGYVKLFVVEERLAALREQLGSG